MRLTVSSDADDLTLSLERWSPPESCGSLIVDAPNVRKMVNLFLGSPVNCRVILRLPDAAINLAGLFAMCGLLSSQPVIEGDCTATSLAAAFKGNTECRYSMHWLAPRTNGCRDYRQMFFGATNYSGNGVQAFDYASVTSPFGMRNFFGGGSGIRTIYYDQLLHHLHSLMLDGNLPTPMDSVDFGASTCSPNLAQKRQELIDYGWGIQDDGVQPDTRSAFERELCDDFDASLSAANTDCVCTSARNGILITPRHTLHVRHYIPPVGSTITLRSGESAKVTATESASVEDLSIVTLDQPVAAKPVAFLPASWAALMPNAYGPPTRYPEGHAPGLAYYNRNNIAGVADLSYVRSVAPVGKMKQSAMPSRADLYQPIAMGDSGTPACFTYRGELALAWPVAMSDGSGPWLAQPDVMAWIRAVTKTDLRIIEA